MAPAGFVGLFSCFILTAEIWSQCWSQLEQQDTAPPYKVPNLTFSSSLQQDLILSFWSASSRKGPRLLQLEVPCVGARLLKAPCISWSRECSWQIYGMWKFALIGIKEKVFRQRISSQMCVYREMGPVESSGPPNHHMNEHYSVHCANCK